MPWRNVDLTRLLELDARLEQLSGFFVGGWVCIERRKRPWRAQRLSAVTADTLVTATGHEFDRETGAPRFESKDMCLRPLTRRNLDYLLVAEALKVAESLRIATLQEREWQALLPAAHVLLNVKEELLQAQYAQQAGNRDT